MEYLVLDAKYVFFIYLKKAKKKKLEGGKGEPDTRKLEKQPFSFEDGKIEHRLFLKLIEKPPKNDQRYIW